jgi:hypothetical protein
VTTRARADVSFALAWRKDARAPACVDEAMLRDAVENRLDRKLFVDPARADIVIEAQESSVSRDQFRARVTERDRHGTLRGVRLLEAQSCPSLRRAATLIVKLLIEPHLSGNRAEEATAERPPPDTHGAFESAPPPSPSETHAALESASPPSPPHRPPGAESAPAPRRDRENHPGLPPFYLSIGLGVGTTVGVLPSASTTAFAVARLASPSSRWSFDWWGGYSLPQRLRRDGAVTGDFSAVEQRVRVCLSFTRWSSYELDACAGVVGGAIVSSTSGIGPEKDRLQPLVGPTAALAFERRAGPLAGRIELGTVYTVKQYDFSYLNPTSERAGFYSTNTVLFFIALSGVGRIS